jgi:hypothetical protein
VGAVFASNSPTGEDLTGGGEEQPEQSGSEGGQTHLSLRSAPRARTAQGRSEEQQPELPQPDQEQEQPEAEQEQEQSEAEQLRGDDLDRALRQAGLPLSGTAREKRARLAQANRNR